MRECMLTWPCDGLQVMAVPASRQASGVSMHELRLPSNSSVTAHRSAALLNSTITASKACLYGILSESSCC